MKTFSVIRRLKSLVKTLQSSQRTLYSVVHPAKVSPQSVVPDHIIKPSYITAGWRPVTRSDPEIKTAPQIRGMRESCKLAREILNKAGLAAQVGVTTDEIDQLVFKESVGSGAYPSPLGYKNFPKSVCTSVNNVACHGIPDNRPLMDGDIINIDITVFYNGFHGDLSETYLIGNVDLEGKALVNVARECRDVGVAVCKPGAKFCDIGNAISELAYGCGFSVVPVFCGHGIGEYFHGPPDIFHIAHEDDATMHPGMTFTIEPILSEGSENVEILEDDWTAVSVDESRSAQFEHTILITGNGVDILTA